MNGMWMGGMGFGWLLGVIAAAAAPNYLLFDNRKYGWRSAEGGY